MPFEPINTQEEFDSRVQELYGDVAGLQGQIDTLNGQRQTDAQTISDLQNQVKGFQTADLKRRVASKKGIPPEMADRLTGETEAELLKDADAVAGMLKALKGPAPLHEPDKNDPSAKDVYMTNLLRQLRGE